MPSAKEATVALRPSNARIADLISATQKGSSTFRQLLETPVSNVTHAFVYFGTCPGGARSCLRFIGTSDAGLYLRITIDERARAPSEVGALLAHELHHAIDVAITPEVKDHRGFRQVFEDNGWKHSGGYETSGAQAIERTVRQELRSSSERQR
jgi:hypothetical protein